jgi:integrase
MKHKAPNGSGTLYQKTTPHGPRWKAVYDLLDEDGKARQITGTGRTAAEAIQRRQTNYDRFKGYPHAGKAVKALTTAQWLMEWHNGIDPEAVKDIVRKNYLARLEKYLIPFIGEIALKDLSRDDIRKLFSETLPALAYDKKKPEARLASTSRHNIYRVLSIALAAAVEQEKIKINPMAGLRAPSRGKSRRSVDEVSRSIPEQLMYFLKDDIDEFRWTLRCIFGFRQSEVLGLRWRDLHNIPQTKRESSEQLIARLQREAGLEPEPERIPTIHINGVLARRAVVHGCGLWNAKAAAYPCGGKTAGVCPKKTGGEGWYWREGPKNVSSQRIIPIPAEMIDAIQRFKLRQDEWRKSKDWKPTSGDHMDELIFTTKAGKPITPNLDNADWKNLLDSHGLPYIDGHTLRHIIITEMALKGYNPSVIQSIVGHTKGSKITAEVYTHIDATFIPMDKIYQQMVTDPRKVPFAIDEAGNEYFGKDPAGAQEQENGASDD